MADYTYRQVSHIRHEWHVPGADYGGWGSAIAEVWKAIASAENTYREVFGKEPTTDNWLRVWAADDRIVLFFEQETNGHDEPEASV